MSIIKRNCRKNSLGLMALEPRWMFDGAAVVDATHAASPTQSSPTSVPDAASSTSHVDAPSVPSAAHAAPDAAARALIPIVAAPTVVREADPTKDGGKKEVAFVDTNVADYKTLEAGIRDGVAIVEIDGGQSGLAQIAKWAETHSGYNAIQLFSNGSEAALQIGTDNVTSATLETAVGQAEMAALGSALKAGGDLLVYGCDVAKGTDGEALMAGIASVTGADIAASSDRTGTAAMGGNWTLEASVGVIEASDALTGAAEAAYTQILAPRSDTAQVDVHSFLSGVAAPTKVRAADPSLTNWCSEVAFIDTSVADYQTLVDGVRPGVEVELIDGGQDGLAQMAVWAETHSGYKAIHVLSHGGEGELDIGSDRITWSNIHNSVTESEFSLIGGALGQGGAFLVYGCDVAKGDEGQKLIYDIADLTGAVVTASTDITGCNNLGGNWVLEASTGVVNATSLSFTNYFYTLPLTDIILAAKSDISVGSSPMSVAVGDFNKDGKADLVVANSGSSSVSVLLGNGNGTFQSGVVYSVGSGPYFVAVADINGDGNLDIITANQTAGTVSILAGDQNGGFSPYATVTAGTASGNTTRSIAFGDFNGDGKLDFVASSYYDTKIYVEKNNGNGTFTASTINTTYQIQAVAVADINKDGKLDIVGTGYSGAKLMVCIGNGAGAFGNPTFAATSRSGNTSIVLSDINGDGNIDALYGNDNGAGISVQYGTGSGTTAATIFGTFNIIQATTQTNSVLYKDMNGDGLPDLLYTYNYSTSPHVAYIRLATAIGTFQSPATYTTGTQPNQVAVGDFDSDGKPDIVTANMTDGTISLLLSAVPTGPTFTSGTTASFSENAIGTVYTAAATASSGGGTISYSLTSGADQAKFAINSSTGALTYASSPNYENPTDVGTNNVYDVIITATDSNGSSTQSVAVTVTDVAPAWTAPGSAISLADTSTTGTSVMAAPTVTGDPSPETWSIQSGNASGLFAINSSTGAITVADATKFNYATTPSYSLVVRETDGTTNADHTVTVNVTSVAPNFINSAVATVSETAATSTQVIDVNGKANNRVDNGAAANDADVAYAITAGNAAGKFTINTTTGIITTTGVLDREATGSYTLTVRATDAVSGKAATQDIVVTVGDVAPAVTAGQSFSVAYTAANSASVGTVANTGDANSVTWSITSGNGTGLFAINASTGAITIADATKFAYPGTTSYTLLVQATDGTTSSSQNVTVNVTAPPPTFSSSATASVSETATVGTSVLDVNATKASGGSADTNITYSITAGNTGSAFAINSSTGVITVAGALDYEQHSSYTLTVHVVDNVGGAADQTVTISANDIHPAVTASQTFSVSDLVANSASVGNVASTGDQNSVTWSITSGNGAGLFAINSSTGAITIADATKFNYLTTPSYTLGIRATDGTASNQTVTVNVTSTAPTFSSLATASISETASVGYAARNVNAVSHAPGASGASDTGLTYSITAGNTGNAFTIDSSTGAVTVNTAGSAIDYETVAGHAFTLTVHALDNTTGTSADQSLTVSVTDVAPAVTAGQSFSVAYTAANAAAVGTVAETGDTTHITWSITGGNAAGLFAINASTGAITIADATKFDYPNTTSYSLTVQATDGHTPSSQTVAVTVTAPPPTFSSSATASVNETATVGTTVLDVDATKASGGAADANITYSITAGNTGSAFAINSATGVITVNSALDYEQHSSYTLTVHAVDNVGGSADQTVTISANDIHPTVTAGQTFSVSDRVVNGAVVGSIASTGDQNSVTWSITSGNSAGLFAINTSTGAITIADATKFNYLTTPSYTLGIRATDGTASNQTVTVNVTSTAPTFSSAAVASVHETAANAITVIDVNALAQNRTDAGTASNDTDITYSITAGNTGSVFAINATTGVITKAGTLDKEQAGSYTVTVQATDAVSGKTATQDIVITVADDAPAITAGQSFSTAYTAANSASVGTVANTGDANSVTWSITGGNATGLFAINASTGAITIADSTKFDYPTTTSYSLTVQATDGHTPSSQTVAVTVTAPPPTFSSSATASVNETATVGTTVLDVNATKAGGGLADTNITYSITAGNTGSAFAINSSTGVITVAGALDYEQHSSYTLTVHVVDNVGGAADQTVTISANDIHPAVTASQTFSVSDLVANSASVGNVASTGDQNSVTWSITSGNGAGLFAINSSTGAITIADATKFNYLTTPSYTLGIRATDGTASDQTVTVDISHVNQAPVITAASSPSVITDYGAVILNSSYADSDGGNNSETVTVSDTTGTLAATQSGGATVTPSNSSHTLTITGTAADINSTLHSLSYAVPNSVTTSGTDTIRINGTDGGHSGTSGGTLAAVEKTIAITYSANDTPSITVPGAQSASSLAQKTISGLSLTDSQGSGTYSATVSANSGNIHLTSVTATAGANDSSSISFTGTKAEIDTALGTLKFTPGSYGSVTITVQVSDGGSSLIGGAKSGSATIAFTATEPPPPPAPTPTPDPTPAPTPTAPPPVVEAPSNTPNVTIVRDTQPTPQFGGNDFSSPSTTSSSPTNSPSTTPSTPAPVAPTTIAPSPVNSAPAVPASTPASSAPIVAAAPAPAVANDTGNRSAPASATLTAATTSDSGFRVAVLAPTSAGGGDALVSVRPMAEVSIGQGGQISYSVGIDTFAHTNAQAVIQLSATQADGKPLPAWLSFDSKSGTLTGTPPAGMNGEVQIRVIARDDQGREAIAVVRIGGEGQRTQPAQPGQQQAPEGQGQRGQPGQPNAPNTQGRPTVAPGATPNGAPERGPTAPAERHGDASDGHSVISLASFRDGHRTGHEHGKPGLTAQLKAAHRGTQLAQQAALYRAAAQMMNSRA